MIATLRYVAAGGVLGTLARWGLLEITDEHATRLVLLAINAVGSFLLGVLIGLNLTRTGRSRVTENQFLLVGTGFCGALTSFSSYATDVAISLDQGDLDAAAVTGFATPLSGGFLAGIGYRGGGRP